MTKSFSNFSTLMQEGLETTLSADSAEVVSLLRSIDQSLKIMAGRVPSVKTQLSDLPAPPSNVIEVDFNRSQKLPNILTYSQIFKSCFALDKTSLNVYILEHTYYLSRSELDVSNLFFNNIYSKAGTLKIKGMRIPIRTNQGTHEKIFYSFDEVFILCQSLKKGKYKKIAESVVQDIKKFEALIEKIKAA